MSKDNFHFDQFKEIITKYGFELGLCCCSLEADKTYQIECDGMNHDKCDKINTRHIHVSFNYLNDCIGSLVIKDCNHYINTCYKGDTILFKGRINSFEELDFILNIFNKNPITKDNIFYYALDNRMYNEMKEKHEKGSKFYSYILNE
tara:strand:+ start:45593 stop:46033 length:441 start_codon:yes stop_codon:yes gene_type:complete